MKVVLCAVFLLSILPACGKAPARDKNGGGQEFQDYGKPGPGTGEACYVGPAAGAHNCVEAQTGDKASIKILNTYCASFEGQRGKGACKTEGHMGTCRFMTDAPNMKIRFYGQTFQQAKAACTEEGGTLYSAY